MIAFTVANRQFVKLSFDPLNPTDPALSIDVPVFVIIFGAVAIGVLLGGIGTWITQHKYRKLARNGQQEVAKWAI